MGDAGGRLALVVVHNDLTRLRLTGVLERRGFEVDALEDGDAAVDRFIRTRPDIAFLSLDIPTLDGHVTALEIRESDPHARLVFVAAKSRLSLAEDAAHSAGAVAVLQTPITAAEIDEAWPTIMGQIPAAPGVADLDELYPDLRSVDGEEVVQVTSLPPPPGGTSDGTMLPALPAPPMVNGTNIGLSGSASQMPINPVAKPPKKKRVLLFLAIGLLVAAFGLIGYAVRQAGLF